MGHGSGWSTAEAAWFTALRSAKRPRCRVIGFPHAGGLPSVFLPVVRRLPEDVEVWAALLPGRSSRIREQPIACMSTLVELLEDAVRPLLDRPVVLLGHSLGARIAFELARRLEAAGTPVEQTVVAACRAPHVPPRGTPLHALPPDLLLRRLRGLGGTPDTVLESRELIALLLPTIRADLQLLETLPPDEGRPLRGALTAFGGRSDPGVTRADLDGWRRHTGGPFRSEFLEGGHFFLHEDPGPFVAQLRAILRQVPS